MHFDDEQLALRDTVRALGARELAEGYLRRATSDEFPWAEYGRLGDQGLLALTLPPELGGQGADPVSAGIVCEELAYADFNLSYLAFASEIAQSVARVHDADLAAERAKAIAAGEHLCALAFTEPAGGSDSSRPRVRARPTGGGHVISGEKTSVTLGGHAHSAVVVATVDPDLGSKGTKRFLVDLDDPTVARQTFADPGFRPLSRSGLSFDNTYVPAGRQIGGRHRSAMASQLAGFDLTRSLLGLMVVGVAQRALDLAVEYTREREAFGHRLSQYQGVSFTIAEHQTQVEAARWLCYRALSLARDRQPHSKEAAMCKWWAPRVAMAAINDCVVLHGHVGWSMEMPLMQMLNDVSGLQIGDGTPQIQKLIISRQLFGREFV